MNDDNKRNESLLMMKKSLYSIFVLVTLLLNIPDLKAQSPLYNDTDGEFQLLSDTDQKTLTHSFYSVSPSKKEVHLKLKKISEDMPKNLCEFNLIQDLEKEFGKQVFYDHGQAMLVIMRQNNDIDDVIYSILVKAWQEWRTPSLVPNLSMNTSKLDELIKVEDLQKIYVDYSNRAANGLCLTQNWQIVVKSLQKFSPDEKKLDSILASANNLANKKGWVSRSDYEYLEFSRRKKIQNHEMTIKEYLQKKSQFGRNVKLEERSNLFSSPTPKTFFQVRQTLSMRHQFYQRFNNNQLILMTKIVSDLKNRLMMQAAQIKITLENGQEEIITLEPMERYKMAVKLMKKELLLLKASPSFGGNAIAYEDLIIAANIKGIVSNAEIDELLKLEEIWNPEQTKSEKILVWARIFVTPAMILAPSGFGFLATLALLAIEATQTNKNEEDSQKDHSLF